jgi:hypothetical protein
MMALLVSNLLSSVEIFVLRKEKLCMEKPVITQKLVLKITQICFAAVQNFPTQARFQHKNDFEQKNFVRELFHGKVRHFSLVKSM